MVSRKMHERQNAGDVTKLRYANEQRQDSKTTNESADSDLLCDTAGYHGKVVPPSRNQELSDKRPQTV